MTKLACNYGISREECQLCGYKGKIQTEHYFSQCQITRKLALIWETTPEDLHGPLERVRRAKNHLKKVELMMERYVDVNKKVVHDNDKTKQANNKTQLIRQL